MTLFDRAPFIVIWETTRACALVLTGSDPLRRPDIAEPV